MKRKTKKKKVFMSADVLVKFGAKTFSNMMIVNNLSIELQLVLLVDAMEIPYSCQVFVFSFLFSFFLVSLFGLLSHVTKERVKIYFFLVKN